MAFRKSRWRNAVGFVEEKIEVRRGGRFGKAGERGAGERAGLLVAFLLLRLQPITQGHQLIHLGDDAFLLGEEEGLEQDIGLDRRYCLPDGQRLCIGTHAHVQKR